jgi:hypothetical protein
MYSAIASNLPLPTTPLLESKHNKLIETWRTLHIEKLLNSYSMFYNIWLIKDYKSGADMARLGQKINT